MKQSDNTKNFIEYVKNLLNTGVVKKQADIVEVLEWDKTTMSNVMNGRANVPLYIYNKFVKVYDIQLHNPDKVTIEQLIRVDAQCSVILTTLAEILAHQKGGTVAKINEDLISMVNSLVISRVGKL